MTSSRNDITMERNLCHYSSNKSSVLQINTICFAKKTRLSNKRKLICKYKTLFERKCRGMDKYVLCVTTVRLICLFMTKCDLIFSQMRAGRFSHMCSNRFSHKCVQADFLTCVQTDFLTNAIQTADGAVGQFTQNIGLPFQGIQQTNMSGEQVSFCLTISIINHLA